MCKEGQNTVQIDGGFVLAATFVWEQNGENGSPLDVTGSGQLQLNGDVQSQINALMDSDDITANNGTGVLKVDFNISNLGQATVSIPEPAPMALLAIGGSLVMLRRKR